MQHLYKKFFLCKRIFFKVNFIYVIKRFFFTCCLLLSHNKKCDKYLKYIAITNNEADAGLLFLSDFHKNNYTFFKARVIA